MEGPTLYPNPTFPRELPPVRCSMEPHIFHHRLPEYEATPLHRLKRLAGRLGIGELLVKDESDRLGLPSFKILGASWAAYTLLSRRLGLAMGSWEGLEELYALLEPLRPMELVTATSGNHGLAVACMAERLGLWAKVFVPEGIAACRIDAIRSHGAEVVVVEGDYSDAVAAAGAMAETGTGTLLLQDIGRDPDDEVLARIVEGYDTLFQEVDEQLLELGIRHPDLVLVQVGAGSLAMAAVRHFYARAADRMPRILGVEAAGAASALASLRAGTNRGLLSTPAWPWIRGGLDGVVAIERGRALQAAGELRSLGISTADAGAAGFAGLLEICSNPSMPFVRERARLTNASAVLVINTEGDIAGTP